MQVMSSGKNISSYHTSPWNKDKKKSSTCWFQAIKNDSCLDGFHPKIQGGMGDGMFSEINEPLHMGVSKNRGGPPKWMVYNGSKPY